MMNKSKTPNYNSLTEVQKAFYDGYDHGYNEASKFIKSESDKVINRIELALWVIVGLIISIIIF